MLFIFFIILCLTLTSPIPIVSHPLSDPLFHLLSPLIPPGRALLCFLISLFSGCTPTSFLYLLHLLPFCPFLHLPSLLIAYPFNIFSYGAHIQPTLQQLLKVGNIYSCSRAPVSGQMIQETHTKNDKHCSHTAACGFKQLLLTQ